MEALLALVGGITLYSLINKKENLILNKIKVKNPEIKPEDKYLIL
jgi:hypothetical protein